jgi:hypothetical protein
MVGRWALASFAGITRTLLWEKGSPDPLRFKWRMPCPAAWRLTVQAETQRFSTFFSDKESPFYDKTDVFFRKSKAFSTAVRRGAIYLYGRTAATPSETLAW